MTGRRIQVTVNYAALLIMNIAFYFVFTGENASHIYDAVGLISIIVVGVTFRNVHWKTGIWKLAHTKSKDLDERELSLTHWALSQSYAWFAVICLVIMFAFSLSSRMNICPQYTISIPLVVSLIYLSHTLPCSMIAWKAGTLPEGTE
ncbi:MAG: hypothetical protein KAR44_12675 [Candidatus Aegiribacteria sp.]|nr:hypothetical protein [Candidatus Aegiribacteria sp.]